MRLPVRASRTELKTVSLAYNWDETGIPPASLRLISYHSRSSYVKVTNAFFWELNGVCQLEQLSLFRERGGEKSLKATLEALSDFLSERPDAEWQHGSCDPEDAQTNVKKWHFINVSVSLIIEAHCTISGSFFKIYNCLTSGSTPRLLKPYFRNGWHFRR